MFDGSSTTIRLLCVVPGVGGDSVVAEVVKVHPRRDVAFLQLEAEKIDSVVVSC